MTQPIEAGSPKPAARTGLTAGTWVALGAMIYAPVVAAIGWAMSINTTMATTALKIDFLNTASASQTSRLDGHDKAIGEHGTRIQRLEDKK